MSRTRRRWSSVSRTAPWTCGMQRSEYGSWTLWSCPWWPVWSVLSRRRCRSSAATATWPGCGRASWYAAANATSVPSKRLDAHRPDDARGPDQAVRVGQDERPDRAHHLGPVEERQAFLGLERERLEAGFAQREHRRHERAADLHLAPTDERQRQVRERREVAGGADAPLLGHDRMDAQAQEVEEAIDEQWPAAAVTQCERVGPQQEHRPDDLAWERRADPGRVAHQEVLLETTGVGRRDRGRGERPEPRRHAVDHGALGDERFDEVARLLHARPGVHVERRVGPGASDRLDVADGQVGPGEDHRTGPRTVRVEVRDVRVSHRPRIVGYAPPRRPRTITRSACSPSSTTSSSRS